MIILLDDDDGQYEDEDEDVRCDDR